MNANEEGKVAVIQGEFHLSSKDASQLVNRELEEWDAILIEGREPVYSFENSQIGFWYYAIGAIFTRTLVSLIHKGKTKLGIANNNPWESADIDAYSRIDASHREIAGVRNSKARCGWLRLGTGAAVWNLLNGDVVKNWNDVFFASYHSILFFYPVLPMLIHIVVVVNPTNSQRRNAVMSDSIVNYSDKNGHEKMLILVGEMHREAIADQLISKGWEIESIPTHSKIGRWISKLYRKFGDWNE